MTKYNACNYLVRPPERASSEERCQISPTKQPEEGAGLSRWRLDEVDVERSEGWLHAETFWSGDNGCTGEECSAC